RRVRAGVRGQEDRRLARVEHEPAGTRGVLLVGGVEVVDRGSVVRTVDPAVPRPELKLRERGICRDGVERAEQLLRVDAVADLLCGRTHPLSSLVVVRRVAGWVVPQRACATASV